MMELADMQDLGSCAERRVGSSPTNRIKYLFFRFICLKGSSILTGTAAFLSAGWFAACEVLNTIKVRAFRQYRKKRWNR